MEPKANQNRPPNGEPVAPSSDAAEASATPDIPQVRPSTSSSASPTGAASQTVDMEGKADLGKRFIAHIIDSIAAYVIGLVPIIGGIAGAAYLVCRDGLEVDFMDRRSLGKKIMKLRPVRLDGQPMDLETSARRNWMWGIGAIISLLLYIPIIGWVLIPVVAIVAIAIGLYEVYKVITDDEGRRWGDEMADTKVVEVAE
jgi:uncharacterized RDD family membrane protein YckC